MHNIMYVCNRLLNHYTVGICICICMCIACADLHNTPNQIHYLLNFSFISTNLNE